MNFFWKIYIVGQIRNKWTIQVHTATRRGHVILDNEQLLLAFDLLYGKDYLPKTNFNSKQRRKIDLQKRFEIVDTLYKNKTNKVLNQQIELAMAICDIGHGILQT